MPFCRECGKQVEDDWVACPACGAAQGSVPSSEINVQDSAVTGGIHQTTNVTQNTPEHLGKAIGVMLKELGFSGQSSPAELTQEQTQEVEKVLEVAEQAAGHGIEIDPWTEMALGKAARLAGRAHTAQQHYLRALETFRKNGDRRTDSFVLEILGYIAEERGDLAEAERLYRESLAISREIGAESSQAQSLRRLATIAKTRGDLAEAEHLYRECLGISREIGNTTMEATILISLGAIHLAKGEMDERHRCFTDAERACREDLAVSRDPSFGKLGDQPSIAFGLGLLGNIADNRGDFAEAERLYRESLAIYRELGLRGFEADLLGFLGNIAEERGDLAEAERLNRESLAIYREIGDRVGEADSPRTTRFSIDWKPR